MTCLPLIGKNNWIELNSVELSWIGVCLIELVLHAIFQPCLVIYGGQFPQLEEQTVPGSEPATFR